MRRLHACGSALLASLRPSWPATSGAAFDAISDSSTYSLRGRHQPSRLQRMCHLPDYSLYLHAAEHARKHATSCSQFWQPRRAAIRKVCSGCWQPASTSEQGSPVIIGAAGGGRGRAADAAVAQLAATRDLTATWLVVDMDAFFASVEELHNPSLVRHCSLQSSRVQLQFPVMHTNLWGVSTLPTHSL